MTRESAITYAALAFLAGLILGLASCAPEPPTTNHSTGQHTCNQ